MNLTPINTTLNVTSKYLQKYNISAHKDVCKTQIHGRSWCQRAVGSFVYPSSSQKRESTAYEALGDFRVPVSRLVEVVLHVGKGAKFGVEKVNCGQNICSRDASVGNGKKQAQSSEGYWIWTHCESKDDN